MVLYYHGAGCSRGALRPFDARRDGSLFGEGAGALVLETEDAAAARSARVSASCWAAAAPARPRACSRSARRRRARARDRPALDDAEMRPYPPVDTTFYRPANQSATDPSVLLVSALVPYKRVDVAIEACRRIGVPLKIVGRGPEQLRLEQLAIGSGGGTNGHVEFLGWRSDEEVRELYQRASAVLLPGIEDFGMVPVEAQACGTPVVALGAGGACETVQHGVTGVLVDHESVEAFANGIDECQRQRFDR